MGRVLTTLGAVALTGTLAYFNPHNQVLKSRELASFVEDINEAQPIISRIKRNYDIEIDYTNLVGLNFHDRARRVTSVILEIEKDLPKLHTPLLLSFDRIVFRERIEGTFRYNEQMCIDTLAGNVSHIDNGCIYLDQDYYRFEVLVHQAAHRFQFFGLF